MTSGCGRRRRRPLRATVEIIYGEPLWTLQRDASRSQRPNPDPSMLDIYRGNALWRDREADGDRVRWCLSDGQSLVYLSGDLAEEGPDRCSS